MFKEWKKLAGKPLRIIDILISIVVIGLSSSRSGTWKGRRDSAYGRTVR